MVTKNITEKKLILSVCKKLKVNTKTNNQPNLKMSKIHRQYVE